MMDEISIPQTGCDFRRGVHGDPFCAGFWSIASSHFQLTNRELEITQLLCRGVSNVEIASKLGVAYPTLRSHVRAIYRKLDCVDRVDAILTLIEFERGQTVPSHP